MVSSSPGLGPIDYVVIELPDNTARLTDLMCGEITSLVSRGVIRILDLVYIGCDEPGHVEVTEFGERTDPRLAVLDDALAEILSLDDITNVAEALDPGRHAALIIWEYRCAASLADAARTEGGSIVAQGRIPTQAILAALSEE